MWPSQLRCQHAARFSLFKRLAVPALLAALSAGAQSQGVPSPAVQASAPGGISDAERAKRDADKVFQWIRIHSDKPRKSQAATAGTTATAAPPAAAPVKLASKSKADSGITETVQPLRGTAARTEPASKVAALSEPTSTTVAAKTDNTAPQLPAASSPPVEEDSPLIPIAKSEPDFPNGLMRQLRKGLVQVSFTVEPDGSVSQAHAVSSTHPRLAPAAVATVSQWRFQPVRHAQQAVVDLGFNID